MAIHTRWMEDSYTRSQLDYSADSTSFQQFPIATAFEQSLPRKNSFRSALLQFEKGPL